MKTTKVRTMPIRDLKKNTDCYKLAKQIKARHEKYLNGVPNVRIEKFIRILQGVSSLTWKYFYKKIHLKLYPYLVNLLYELVSNF